MKKVLLHIGSTKTGTSAIQSMIAADRQHLAEQDILVPRGRHDSKAGAGRVAGGNTLVLDRFLARAVSDEKGAVHELIALFEANFRHHPYRTVVISGESMSDMSKESLALIRRGLLASHDSVEAIYYVRNVVDHAVSQYGEFVKRRKMVKTFAEYAETYVPKYKAVTEKFEAVFGSNSVKISLYDAVRTDVIGDFLARIGATRPGNPQAPDHVNRSLSLQELDFIRSLNGLQIDPSTLPGSVEMYCFETAKKGSDSLRPSPEDVAVIGRSAGEVIDFVNGRLTPEARLKLVSDGLMREALPVSPASEPQLVGQIAQAFLVASLLVSSDRIETLKAERLVQDGKFADAILVLVRLIERNDAPEHHHTLARCYAALDRKAKALQHARQCFALRPDLQANTSLFMNLLIELNRLAETDDVLSQASRSGYDSHLQFFFMGQLAMKRKKRGEAEKHFAAARALNPNNKSYEIWESRAKKPAGRARTEVGNEPSM